MMRRYVEEFRWDDSVWGSSWSGMAASLLAYLLLVPLLKLLLLFLRSKPLPLGPFPALYHLSLLLASASVFAGCLHSACLEIHESRWLWRGTRTEMEWLLCFPVGMRPVGRVFFWTYAFYLSNYYEFLETFILLLQKRNPSSGHAFRHVGMVLMCFLQLQFSQSLQILLLLFETSNNFVKHLYCMLLNLGMAPSWSCNAVRICRSVKWVATCSASLGLLFLHLTITEGCNGMSAWIFITLLRGALMYVAYNLDRNGHLD